MAYTLWAITPSLAFLLSTAIGIYVLRRNPRAPANRAFALWMAFYAIWNLGKIGMRSSEDPAGALLWAKFAYLGFLFIAPSFANFALRLVGKRFGPVLLFLPFVLLAATLPTELLISGVQHYAWGYHFGYGMLFPLFGAFSLLTMLFAVSYIFLVTRASRLLRNAERDVPDRLARKKFGYVLYPAAGTLIYLGVSDIVLPALGLIAFSFSGILTSFMALSIAYAFAIKE